MSTKPTRNKPYMKPLRVGPHIKWPIGRKALAEKLAMCLSIPEEDIVKVLRVVEYSIWNDQMKRKLDQLRANG